MTKKTMKKAIPMIIGGLIVALLVSIIPGSFLAEASKGSMNSKPDKDIVQEIKVNKNVFTKLKTDTYIPLESAEALALTKISDKTAKITEIEVVLIDNQIHYVVEVTTANKDINKTFKISINGVTGKIIDIDVDIKDPVKDQVKDPVKEGKYITKEESIKIALAKIGKDAKLDEIELEDDDDDNDTPIYEIEMYDDNYEYELEIHAITGEILKFKKERD